MAKTPFWQSIQNNRFLRPFQVRDISGRTLFDRARLIGILILIAALLFVLVSSRQLNLLVNRDEIETTESEFISQFYPAYDSLYYWLNYQGNLAEKLIPYLNSETGYERFLASIQDNLGQIDLKYIQFGQVGVNNQWLATPTRDDEQRAWEVTGDVNQDFSAWLLTQQLETERIYWYGGRPDAADEISLFWLSMTEDGEQVYFLAAIDFDYRLTNLVAPSDETLVGAAIFLSPGRQQQVYPLQAAQSELTATATADLRPEVMASHRSLLAGSGDSLLSAEMLARYQAGNQSIFLVRLERQNYWLKVLPAATHTEYDTLAIVLHETEALSRLGIQVSWVQIILIVIIVYNVLCFFFYYWHYSRRFYFTNQIKDIIKNGENGRLEFKSTLRYDLQEKQLNKNLESAIIKSIAAFNNTDGGMLIIGVSDDAHILGLEDDYSTLKKPNKDGFELHLRALVSQAYGQHFAARRIEIFFPVIENKEVCVVNVKKGRSALYTTMPDKNGTKQEKFYIRMGNSSREIEKLSDIVDYQNQRFKVRLPKWGKK